MSSHSSCASSGIKIDFKKNNTKHVFKTFADNGELNNAYVSSVTLRSFHLQNGFAAAFSNHLYVSFAGVNLKTGNKKFLTMQRYDEGDVVHWGSLSHPEKDGDRQESETINISHKKIPLLMIMAVAADMSETVYSSMGANCHWHAKTLYHCCRKMEFNYYNEKINEIYQRIKYRYIWGCFARWGSHVDEMQNASWEKTWCKVARWCDGKAARTATALGVYGVRTIDIETEVVDRDANIEVAVATQPYMAEWEKKPSSAYNISAVSCESCVAFWKEAPNQQQDYVQSADSNDTYQAWWEKKPSSAYNMSAASCESCVAFWKEAPNQVQD